MTERITPEQVVFWYEENKNRRDRHNVTPMHILAALNQHIRGTVQWYEYYVKPWDETLVIEACTSSESDADFLVRFKVTLVDWFKQRYGSCPVPRVEFVHKTESAGVA